MTEKLKFALGRVENIAGKGENAGYIIVFFFPKAFLSKVMVDQILSGYKKSCLTYCKTTILGKTKLKAFVDYDANLNKRNLNLYKKLRNKKFKFV